jgi:hypothetical protein
MAIEEEGVILSEIGASASTPDTIMANEGTQQCSATDN